VRVSRDSTSSPSLPPGTVRLLALRACSNATGEDLVRWATDALGDGWDSSALRILAGLDLGGTPSFWEANEDLKRALAELGIPDAEPGVTGRLSVDELSRDRAWPALPA
jgi:hypothetical protein